MDAHARDPRRRWSGLLRGRLGFDGLVVLVVSDALEMGAIAGSWPLLVAAKRALAADVDQLLLSTTPA